MKAKMPKWTTVGLIIGVVVVCIALYFLLSPNSQFSAYKAGGSAAQPRVMTL